MTGGSAASLGALPAPARALLEEARRAVLATIDDRDRAHAVPVCFALRNEEIVTAVDQKPKRGRPLARVAHVRSRGTATLVADRWDEDWSALAWVMVQGRAEIRPAGSADRELTARYPQYEGDPPRGEVIALVPERVLWWTWE
jgi:PPOX class probable F420-dependent enzyme